MSNKANIYRSMKLYSQATSLLEQAIQKINEEESPHKGAVSLTNDTFGNVLMSQGEYREASDLFEIAAAMRKAICANGVTHVESMMYLAKGATNTAMPTNTFISEVLDIQKHGRRR